MSKVVPVDQYNGRCPLCHGSIRAGDYVVLDAKSGLRCHDFYMDC